MFSWMVETKKCSKCNKIKNIEDFHVCKKEKDLRRSECKECRREWYRNNAEYEKSRVREWRLKNKHKHFIRSMEWQKKHPWYSSYRSARERCIREKAISYKYYGGRGILFLMSINDFEVLWFRDKAYLMKRPSIDRIDNDGDYIIKNCRFIELGDNIRKEMEGRACKCSLG